MPKDTTINPRSNVFRAFKRKRRFTSLTVFLFPLDFVLRTDAHHSVGAMKWNEMQFLLGTSRSQNSPGERPQFFGQLHDCRCQKPLNLGERPVCD
jgi:hypothetical protein